MEHSGANRVTRRQLLVGLGVAGGLVAAGAGTLYARAGVLAVRPSKVPGEGTPRVLAEHSGQWNQVLQEVPRPQEVFDPRTLDDLPGPVRRWLVHSIEPGTPLWRGAAFHIDGQIKLKGWAPYTSSMLLVPTTRRIWAARATMNGLPVTGFDRFFDGDGEMRWRVLGVVPVVSEHNEQVAFSAEAVPGLEMGLCPTAFQALSWQQVGPDEAEGSWTGVHAEHRVRFRFDTEGRLLKAWGPRSGDVNGDGTFSDGMFVGESLEERSFNGITVMGSFRAGWGTPDGELTDGEFFRGQITSARWL